MENLIEQTDLELITFKADGSLVEVSPAFFKIIGYNKKDIGKLNFWELSDSGYKQYEVNQLMSNYLYIKNCFHKKGHRIPLYVKCLKYDEDAEIISCLVWVMKAKLQVESISTSKGQLLLNLNKNEVFDSGNFDLACKLITEAATKGLSIARGSIWFFDETKDKLILHDLYEVKSRKHQNNFELNSAEYPIYFESLKSDKAIIADDAHSHPATKEFSDIYLTPLGISSMLDSPIRYKGELIGVLCNEHIGPEKHWTLEEESFSSALTDLVSRCLSARESLKYKEQLEVQNKELENIIQKRTEEVVLAKEAAENANKSKSLFLANMSHEIRTPMNAILGFTELLKNKINDPVQSHWLELIQKSGSNLLHLINDILDISKIEAGKLRVSHDFFLISSLIEEVTDFMRFEANRKNIAINTRCANLNNCEFSLDEFRVRQVLINLLSNAIKFTQEGFITVSANVENDTLIIVVEDTGIGIDNTDLNKIFSTFEQADNSKNEHGGTGLGLSISKKLIELMKGTIAVSSEPGKGSVFEIKFPGVLQRKYIHKPKEDGFKYKFAQSDIVIVDDNFMSREVLEYTLKEMNLNVRSFSNARAALKAVKEREPDMVITDIHMPGTNGYKLCKQLKKLNEKLPVLALSATYLTEKSTYKDDVFNTILRKPFEKEALCLAMSEFLKFTRTTAEGTPEAIKLFQAKDVLDSKAHDFKLLYHTFNPKIKVLNKTLAINDFKEFLTDFEKFCTKQNYESLFPWIDTLKLKFRDFEITSLLDEINTFLSIIKSH